MFTHAVKVVFLLSPLNGPETCSGFCKWLSVYLQSTIRNIVLIAFSVFAQTRLWNCWGHVVQNSLYLRSSSGTYHYLFRSGHFRLAFIDSPATTPRPLIDQSYLILELGSRCHMYVLDRCLICYLALTCIQDVSIFQWHRGWALVLHAIYDGKNRALKVSSTQGLGGCARHHFHGVGPSTSCMPFSGKDKCRLEANRT